MKSPCRKKFPSILFSFFVLLSALYFFFLKEAKFRTEVGHVHKLYMENSANDSGLEGNFSLTGLKALAEIGKRSVKVFKKRTYSLVDLEDLYLMEPTSKSEMKRRASEAVFLSSKVNLDDYSSLHYIDLGARTFSSSVLWFKNHYPKFSKGFQITAFEADPIYKSEYEKMQDVNFHNVAVWVRNETLRFGGKMGRVQSRKACKKECKKDGSYTVQGINLSEYFLNTLLPTDFVVLKMDIEGAEYSVIPHMLESGSFNLIDEFFLEGHTIKLSKLEEVRHRKYEHIVNMLSTIRSLGVWAHEWF